METAWIDEMASGGLSSKWAEDLEAELIRLEAEIDGKKRPLITPGNKCCATMDPDSDQVPTLDEFKLFSRNFVHMCMKHLRVDSPINIQRDHMRQD